MALTSGTHIGPYEITGTLGAGGMGEVYRARDARLARDVALKVLPDSFADDPDRLARFEREAQVLAALKHPNIGAIYGLEETNGIRALVLELIEGDTLADRIGRGPVPVDEALAIAKQIAEALEAAHEQGIVHRDLKPANIKVSTDGAVKVLDFGLAKLQQASGAGLQASDVTASPTLTSPAMMTGVGVILGTAAYMAPEQAKGRPADKRSDIWAFGCVLYEMLTGKRAFEGEDVGDTLAAVLRGEPDWHALDRAHTRHLAPLLRRCLARDPRRRLRDIGDAWLLLEPTSSAADARRPVAWRVGASVALGAAGLLAVALMLGPRAATEPQPPVAFVERPPPGTEFARAPLPSPDGRHLAMLLEDEQRETSIWIRSIGEPGARALPGTQGSLAMFWSPDSRNLAFATSEQLRRIGLDGASPQLVANLRVMPQSSGVWTDDNQIIVATDRSIVRVSAAGGTPQTIVQREGARYKDVNLVGRRLLYGEFGSTWAIYTVSVDGGEPALVRSGGAVTVFDAAVRVLPPDVLLFREGSVLLGQRFESGGASLVGEPFTVAERVPRDGFNVGASGMLALLQGDAAGAALTWFDRQGRLLATLPSSGTDSEIDLSPDGRTLLVVRSDASTNLDVWLQPLDGNAPVRFTVDPATDHGPVFSQDGHRVAWESHTDGTLSLMQRPADGSAPASVIKVWGRPGGPKDWSPDGRLILYRSDDGGTTGSNLWLVAVDGSSEPIPFADSPFNEIDGRFSPDGRFVAYASDETGEPEVYVQRLDGTGQTSARWRVSAAGGRAPTWRRDGRELFFLAGESLMAADVRIDRGVFDASAPRALFTFRAAGSLNSYAATPDGQRFLVRTRDTGQNTSLATIVLNWRPPQAP